MTQQQAEPQADYVASDLSSWVGRDGRFYSLTSGREITEPLRLSEQNSTTLRHALMGHGLPVSGTKRQQAVRLANASVTAAHVEAWHTWRGRDAAPCGQSTGCRHVYPDGTRCTLSAETHEGLGAQMDHHAITPAGSES